MELQDIKQFFEENKDNEGVKNYLQELSNPTTDKVQSFLESEDGKKLLQPKLDAYFTKGLQTFKEKSMPKLIDEEIKQRFPEADPKDVQLKELEAQIKKMQKEKEYETLKNKAFSLASEKKLPINLIDFFIGQDEESTTNNLTKLEQVFNSHLQTAIEEKLKTNGTNLTEGNSSTSSNLEEMSFEEYAKARKNQG